METTAATEREGQLKSAVVDVSNAAAEATDGCVSDLKQREQIGALLKRSCSRAANGGNQEDQDGAELRARDHEMTGLLCRGDGEYAVYQLVQRHLGEIHRRSCELLFHLIVVFWADHGNQDEVETMWWWLGSSASDRPTSPEDGATLQIGRCRATGDNNQGEEEKLEAGTVEDARSPSAAVSDDQDPAFLGESSSGSELSFNQQQHSKHYGGDEMNSNPVMESCWFSNQNAESSSGDRSSGGVSSLSSRSLGDSDRSSLSHEPADCLMENEKPLQPFVETRVPQADFTFGVDMLALWRGSKSKSSSGKSKSESEGSSSCSSESSTLQDGEASSQPSRSISRSASIEDLDSDSIGAVSSLSSFSVQSGVCKISRPRLIENIPVATTVVDDTSEGSRDVDVTTPAYPRYWSYQDFVKPESPGGAMECEPAQRPHHFKRDHYGTRLKLSKRLPLQQERTDINTNQPQFVGDDAELFIKFSELEGILVDHVPRRNGFFLDVGCGTSSVCKEMVLHGYNHVYGVDIASQKIQFQQDQCKGLQEFVRFQEMDASELKFPDKLFDCIFTKAVLDIVASSYVYEPSIDDNCDELQRVLREICRCLQPGGVWIIVSCHGSRSAAATRDANTDDRLCTSWWQWKCIAEFILRHYDRVKTYGAGIPLMQHGKRVKPFVVMVYKHKETTRQQRLTRLYRNQLEEKRSDREFAVATQWLAEKRRVQAEEASNVRETRQMVAEDAISRFRVSDLAYGPAVRAREATRKEIYRAILDADRVLMAAEDALAAAVRVETSALLAFFTNVLVDIVDAAVKIVMTKEESKQREKVVLDGDLQTSIPEEKSTSAAARAFIDLQHEKLSKTTTSHNVVDEIVPSATVCDVAGSTAAEQPESTRRDEQFVVGSGEPQMTEDPNLSHSQESAVANLGSESSNERGSLAHELEISADTRDDHPAIGNDAHMLKVEGDEQLLGEVPTEAPGSREADVMTSESEQRSNSGLTPPTILAESLSDKKPKVASSDSPIEEQNTRSTVPEVPANASQPDAATEFSKRSNNSGGRELKVEHASANCLQGGRDHHADKSDDGVNVREAAEELSLHDTAAATQEGIYCPPTTVAATEQSCDSELTSESNCIPTHQSEQTQSVSSTSEPGRSYNTLPTEAATSSSQAADANARISSSDSNTVQSNAALIPMSKSANSEDIPASETANTAQIAAVETSTSKTDLVSGITGTVADVLDNGAALTELTPDEKNEVGQETFADPVFEDPLLSTVDDDQSVPPVLLSSDDDEMEGAIKGGSTRAREPSTLQGDENHATGPSQSGEQDPSNDIVSNSQTPLTLQDHVDDAEQSDEIVNRSCSEALARIVERICRDAEE